MAFRCLCAGLAGVIVGCIGAGSAAALGLPSTSFGASVSIRPVNGQLTPTDLSAGSAAGMGVARIGVFDGVTANSDAVVRLLAQAHVALYPIMGVPCPSGKSSCSDAASSAPAVSASQIAQIVTAFAQRYGAIQPDGSGGTYWKANPQLPYEPIESYEIGNEPNLPLYWVVDGTHLHWVDPSNPNAVDAGDYVLVYKAVRSALHAVDPTAKAIVGGLADSASDGVDVEHDEQFLSAFAPGSIDAVGFHPWVFDVSDSLLEPDTSAVRTWMDKNGFAGAPLDVNEIGACQSNPHAIDANRCPADESQTSEQWGQVATSYMKWALCTPWVGVENVQAFYWGDEPQAASEVYLPLFDSSSTVTPYGTDYLNMVKQLTTDGCPGSTTSSSSTSSTSTTSSRSTTTSTSPTTSTTTTSTSSTTTTSTSPTSTTPTSTTPTTSASTSTSTASRTSTSTTTAPTSTTSSTSTSTTTAPTATTQSTPSTTETGTTLGVGPGTTTTTQTSSTTSKPPAKSRPPIVTPTRPAGVFRVMHVSIRGRIVTVVVECVLGGARVTAVARRFGGGRIVRRLVRIRIDGSLLTFRVRLSAGRWLLVAQEARVRGYRAMSRRATLKIGGPVRAASQHTRWHLASRIHRTGFDLRAPIVRVNLSGVVPPYVNVACMWRAGSDWSPWRTSCVSLPALPMLG